eukprot:gene674-2105_t
MSDHDTSAIDNAKRSLAPLAKLEDWSSKDPSNISIDITIAQGDSNESQSSSSVAIGGRVFTDNVQRHAGCLFADDPYGDTLPNTPAVLTGLLDTWPAFAHENHPDGSSSPSWSVLQDFARRTKDRVSLDGGPGFARMSLGCGRVTLADYQLYCERGADGDAAPLYVFDPDILGSSFVDDGSKVSDAVSPIPTCFSKDRMACINGTTFRPLPPAWLLVGVTRSGTPIHDHPLTVAWNALLAGCKLWCCLPPKADEGLLLLNLDDDADNDFDLSAIQWFQQCADCQDLADNHGAKFIVQRPGEVVFLPCGWFHVILNVETSTAISSSLTLQRDLQPGLNLLRESGEDSDEEFASQWLKCLQEEEDSQQLLSKDSR